MRLRGSYSLRQQFWIRAQAPGYSSSPLIPCRAPLCHIVWSLHADDRGKTGMAIPKTRKKIERRERDSAYTVWFFLHHHSRNDLLFSPQLSASPLSFLSLSFLGALSFGNWIFQSIISPRARQHAPTIWILYWVAPGAALLVFHPLCGCLPGGGLSLSFFLSFFRSLSLSLSFSLSLFIYLYIYICRPVSLYVTLCAFFFFSTVCHLSDNYSLRVKRLYFASDSACFVDWIVNHMYDSCIPLLITLHH